MSWDAFGVSKDSNFFVKGLPYKVKAFELVDKCTYKCSNYKISLGKSMMELLLRSRTLSEVSWLIF